MQQARHVWLVDAVTIAVSVLLLQQAGIFYIARYFGAPWSGGDASLIHAHAGLLFATALVARDRRVLAAGFLATFAGWCLIVLRYDLFEWAQALVVVVDMVLLFLWTERCAAWVGAPYGARHGFAVGDLARFVPIGLVLYPLGWSVVSALSRVLVGEPADVYLNESVQLLLAKHVGIACLTLPFLLLWTDGLRGFRRLHRLAIVALLAAAVLLLSLALNRVLTSGSDAWLLRLHDYRLTVGAVLAAAILAFPARWSMPLLAAIHFTMLHVLAVAANQAQAVDEIWRLIVHVVELNVLSLLLVAMYLVNRDRRSAFVRIEHSAHRDADTGLANANALRHAWAERKQPPDQIGFLSFDHVDMLVGSYGWPALQAMLRSIGRQLSSQVGVYHLGGAQFVLLPLPRSSRMPDWKGLLQGLQKNGFELNGARLRVTPFLGLASPKSLALEDLDECIADAGEASMQARRRSEADPVSAIDEHGGQVPAVARRRRLQNVTDVIRQVRDGNIELYMQPIVQIDGSPPRKGVSGEILCRLGDGRGGLLMPDQFIPLLESNGNIAELDLAVLAALFEGLRRDPVLRTSVERLYVNLSGVSLSADSFRSRLKAMLAGAPVPPQALCFELTETAMISHYQQAARLFAELRESGCWLALDDFGSGMQNFTRLKELPVQIIKIDGEFVRNARQDRGDYEIVRAAVAVAKANGLSTIAEHVEDAETDRCMRDLGVAWGQGYFYGKPVPLKGFAPDCAQAVVS